MQIEKKVLVKPNDKENELPVNFEDFERLK